MRVSKKRVFTMSLCIEQCPPASITLSCGACGADCPSGRRRRDPFGRWYCDSCGSKIQKAVRDAIDATPLLAYFVVTIPGFMRYYRPEPIGLGRQYDGVAFHYQPPPRSFPKHTPRPLGFPSPNCSSCGLAIPKRASSSRRGIHPHAVYCAPCGLAMRRAAARITRADDLLVNTYRVMPEIVRRFLRDDILTWLNHFPRRSQKVSGVLRA